MPAPKAIDRPTTKILGGITFEDPCVWLYPDTREPLEWQRLQRGAAPARPG